MQVLEGPGGTHKRHRWLQLNVHHNADVPTNQNHINSIFSRVGPDPHMYYSRLAPQIQIQIQNILVTHATSC